MNTPNHTITIDGSSGEGGGQVLRTSLSLSAALGVPVLVENVRGGRKKPGLLRQHLACVRVAAATCDADVVGAELGSGEVLFTPGALRPIQRVVKVGSAGSTTLVLQTALLPLALANGTSTLEIQGGTHNPWAPPFEALDLSFRPLLAALGARFELILARHGFHPAGGGSIHVTMHALADVTPLSLLERGAPTEHYVQTITSQIARRVAEREWDAARRVLAWPSEQWRNVQVEAALCPGNLVNVVMGFETITEVTTAFGERKKSAEHVGGEAARAARKYLEHDAPVGQHLADQLLLPLALLGGGTFRTSTPTPHFQTNVETIAQFLGDVVTVERHDEHDAIVTVRGRL